MTNEERAAERAAEIAARCRERMELGESVDLDDVVRAHPDLVGLGIDESTALVVDIRGKRLHVIGNSYVVACVPEAPKPDDPALKTAATPAPGHPNLVFLKPGDEADLSSIRTLSTDNVVEGIDFEAL